MSKPTLTALIELIGGYFGLLGLGWMVAGDVLRGLLILVGYWLVLSIAGFLTMVTFGLAGFVLAPLYLIAPIISAFMAYQFARDKW
jgi:hypothetical protein